MFFWVTKASRAWIIGLWFTTLKDYDGSVMSYHLKAD